MPTSPVDQAPEVSVVVATYGRPDTLARTLDSLVAQTLAKARFEVVVIVNGPPGETPDVVARYAAAHPDLALRLLVTEKAGAAHARSLGVRAARGTWMTMVDDDDWVSPAYVERMLDAIRPGIIPLVDIADVPDGGEPSFDNSYSLRFRRHRGRVVPGTVIPPAMSFNVCKLIPTSTACEVLFDERLRSASDTLFWLRVYERTRCLLHVLDVDDAVYFRTTEAGSLSRQGTTYDFSVSRRLDAYASLAEIPAEAPETANVMLARTAGSLARHMNDYLRQHPEQHTEVEDDVRRRGVPGVAWQRANRDLATELVVVGDLEHPAPLDPLTTARGILARGEVVDLVGTLPWRDVPPWVPDFLDTRLGLRDRALVRGMPDPWQRVLALADRIEVLEQRRRDEGVAPHNRLRSHDPTGVAHLAAARTRLRRADLHWTAELSTPLDEAAARPGDPDGDLAGLLAELADGLDRVSLGEDAVLPGLALALVAARADAIVAPTEALRTEVLRQLAGSPYADRAATVLTVEEPAAVPEPMRTTAPHGVALAPGLVHVGGAVTGATDFLDPLADALLDAPGVRERLRLHLVTTDPDALRDAAWRAGLGDVVVAHPPLAPSALLNLYADLDAVLVTDGPEPALRAPAYLPDALAGPTPAWLLSRPGGVLAATPGATWSTSLDDPGAVGRVLADLVAEAPPA